MAQVIGTTEISYVIENLIKNANKYLIFITPFIQLNPRLKTLIKNRIHEIDRTIIASRAEKLSVEDLDWFIKENNIEFIDLPTLHAKCYMNEFEALITSMNLYEYSQINNLELGVHLTKKERGKELHDLVYEIDIILNSSDLKINLSELYKDFGVLTMGKLYSELQKKYTFSFEEDDDYEYDNAYRSVCDIARNLYDFNEDDLYSDKTAVLRSTSLPKDVYNKLLKEISKHGKRNF